MDCCMPFGVWGISSAAPYTVGNAQSQYGQYGPYIVDAAAGSRGYIYHNDRASLHGDFGYDHGMAETSWPIKAAKVPGWYPYRYCQSWPPISSADESAEEQWSCDLVNYEEREFNGLPRGNESELPLLRFVRRGVFGSRVIYVDGKQKYVVYRCTPDYIGPTALPEQLAGGAPNEQGYPYAWLDNAEGMSVGRHIQIDIDTEQVVGDYNCMWFDDGSIDGGFNMSTVMRTAWAHVEYDSYVVKGLAGSWGYIECVTQSQCFGKDYFVMSSYKPTFTKANTIPDDIVPWGVGRIKYSGYEVFCTDNNTYKTGKDYDGDYAVMLPCHRADLTSTGTNEEPRVIARSYEPGTGKWKLVTGIWLNNDIRLGSGRSWNEREAADDMLNGSADGTLREEEVDNIIYEGDEQPEVFCYNRVRGKDIVIYSLLGDPNPNNIFTPEATFEPDTGLRYASRKQNNPGTSLSPDDLGAVCDLIPTITGSQTGIDTTTIDTTGFSLVKQFILQTYDSILGDEQNWPVGVKIESKTGNLEWRFRLARRDAGGGLIDATDYSPEYTTASTQTQTFSFLEEGDTWNKNQRLTLDIELRSTDSNPVSMSIATNTEDTYVDMPLTALGDLNMGLPNGVFFSTRGDHGNSWMPENDVYYLDGAPDYGVIDFSKWAAKAHSSPLYQGLTILDIEINIVEPSDNNIEFDYRFDNRATAGDFPNYAIINFPATDDDSNKDTFYFTIDGNVVKTWDNSDADGSPELFAEFHHFDLTGDPETAGYASLLTAGKHKLSWVLNRVTTANDVFPIFAAIDNVKFPTITTVDPEGRACYYDGEVNRDIIHKLRPVRDDLTTVAVPSNTNPHYITMDYEDRIWYGNPHGVIRLAEDNISKDVEVRFTAVPGEDSNAGGIYRECSSDSCGTCSPTDEETPEVLLDPPYGAFQIIPTHNNIQVRGANASIKDATAIPLDLECDPAGAHEYRLHPNAYAGPPGGLSWASRVHAWTISLDGTVRIPHIEIAYRFNKDIPTYPVKLTSFPSPPYGTDITAPSPRWDKLQPLKFARNLESGDLSNRIMRSNLIIARSYTDATSRYPAYRWIQNDNNDPTPEDDDWESYWAIHPEVSYPSVLRYIWPIYFPGTSRPPLGVFFHNSEVGVGGGYGKDTCVKTYEFIPGTGPEDPDVTNEIQTLVVGLKPSLYGTPPQIDFDAVDCDCSCCQDIIDNVFPFTGTQSRNIYPGA